MGQMRRCIARRMVPHSPPRDSTSSSGVTSEMTLFLGFWCQAGKVVKTDDLMMLHQNFDFSARRLLAKQPRLDDLSVIENQHITLFKMVANMTEKVILDQALGRIDFQQAACCTSQSLLRKIQEPLRTLAFV